MSVLSAQEFYRQYGGQNVIALDEDGNKVTGKLMSISWRETLGLKLPSGESLQVWYDPETVRPIK